MKKVTPNPPSSTSDDDPQLPPDVIFTVRPGLSTEAALSNASEMLESATVVPTTVPNSSMVRAASTCWRWCS